MLNDRMFLLLGGMMVVPTICIVLQLDPGTATMLTMGANLGLLYYLRKSFKGNLSSILGPTKLKWQCLTCQGTKFDSKGTCHRCGSKSRRPI